MAVIAVLVIDDDVLDRRAVARALEQLGPGYELHEAGDSGHGVECAVARAFDCILVDYNLPGMNGLEILIKLRGELNVTTPIVMLTGSGNEMVAVEAMKRGASDYLSKEELGPASLLRVVSNAIEKRELQKSSEEAQLALKQMALYDSLTGLGNRNLFHIQLERAVGVSRRKNTTFVLLMMDLDKFKAINDGFGHEAGDAVLAAVGLRLRGISRAADAYFRMGGDEFMAILDVESDGNSAARRIVTAIAEPVAFGPHALAVEISIGMATYPADGGDPMQLIRAADLAMYGAKKSFSAAGTSAAAE
jgi:diguanylate cyclase (GGDEF)-like protein